LASLKPERQQQEIIENCTFLQETIDKEVKLLSFPYGNYNEETLTVAANAGLHAAFTTEEKVVQSNSLKYRLGRYPVKNITGVELQTNLKKWSL
jgi:peptidoglycan/xylan/chitin deacetylase (PgdA/CDA1 family)